MAQENEYISSAAETMFASSQDESMRIFMEGVEEANRIRRGQEIRIERAEAALAKREKIIAEKEKDILKKDEVIAEKEKEILRLKALLAAAQQQ